MGVNVGVFLCWLSLNLWVVQDGLAHAQQLERGASTEQSSTEWENR